MGLYLTCLTAAGPCPRACWCSCPAPCPGCTPPRHTAPSWGQRGRRAWMCRQRRSGCHASSFHPEVGKYERLLQFSSFPSYPFLSVHIIENPTQEDCWEDRNQSCCYHPSWRIFNGFDFLLLQVCCNIELLFKFWTKLFSINLRSACILRGCPRISITSFSFTFSVITLTASVASIGSFSVNVWWMKERWMNEQQSHHLHKLHTGFQFPALVWQT